MIFVHLILLWMSEHSAFFIMACSNVLPFHLICKVFGIILFAKHLRLKILVVLDLTSHISNFSNFLASSSVPGVPCHNYQLYSQQFSCSTNYTVCNCSTIQLPIQAVKKVTSHSKAYNGHTQVVELC